MSDKPEQITSSVEYIKRFMSIKTKYIFAGLAVLTFIALFTAGSFIFTLHLESDGQRIHLAGKLRMLSFKMAWLLNKAWGESGAIQKNTLHILRNEAVPQFEEILSVLRYGRPDNGLAPMRHRAKEIISRLDNIEGLWRFEVLPMVLKAAEETERGESTSRYKHNAIINSYVNDIDAFVAAIANNYESELSRYKKYRASALVFSLLVFAGIWLLIKKRFISPIAGLTDASMEIARGNFNIMIEKTSNDEIGLLQDNFNSMAGNLHLLFNQKMRHIKELLALADSSNDLGRLPMEGNIYRSICETAVSKFNLKMAWIGLVDEETNDVLSTAHAGSEDGYLSDVKFTWDNVPAEIAPTCTALKTRLPEVIHDIAAYPVQTTWKIEGIKRGFRSSISMPLISSYDKVIALLNLYSDEPGFFSEEKTKLFHIFANLATSAIENWQHIREISMNLQDISFAHNKLKEYHEHYESLVNTVEGIVWEADPKTLRYTFVSRKAENILGYPVEEWLNDSEFCNRLIHPADRIWVASLCKRMTLDKKDHTLEYRAVTADGRTVWLKNIATVIVRDGEPARLQGIMIDITEHKESENSLRKYSEMLAEQFKLISRSQKEWRETFDSITDLISIHDSEFNILKANKAFVEHFGIGFSDLHKKKCYELFHDTDEPVHNCPHKTTLQKGCPVTEEVLDLKTNRIFRVSTFPYYSSGRNIAGSIHIARDITDEKEKDAQIIMNDKLAALGQMASGIAHEINNPLASMLGCAEGLLSKVKSGQYDPVHFTKYLQMINEEILRCKEITTSVLSFVRKTAYEKKELNIHKLLDNALEIIGFQGRLKKIEVIKRYEQDMPVVHGSEGELRQVFVAIITNALDAMESCGVLTLETGVVSSPYGLSRETEGVFTETGEVQGSVFIKIGDSGPGIPPEKAGKIFDPFYTTKADKGGTGLGLAVARKIISNHGGSIDLISEQGKGAIFKITLPVQ